MGNNDLIWEYVLDCAAGRSAYSDCTPVWQVGAIGVLLVLAIVTFMILVSVRLREEARLAPI